MMSFVAVVVMIGGVWGSQDRFTGKVHATEGILVPPMGLLLLIGAFALFGFLIKKFYDAGK